MDHDMFVHWNGQRYHVRGYFSGDGQHWLAIWDDESRRYDSSQPSGYPTLYRHDDDGLSAAYERWHALTSGKE